MVGLRLTVIFPRSVRRRETWQPIVRSFRACSGGSGFFHVRCAALPRASAAIYKIYSLRWADGQGILGVQGICASVFVFPSVDDAARRTIYVVPCHVCVRPCETGLEVALGGGWARRLEAHVRVRRWCCSLWR